MRVRGFGLRTGNQLCFPVVARPFLDDARRCTAVYVLWSLIRVPSCYMILRLKDSPLVDNTPGMPCAVTGLFGCTPTTENYSGCHIACRVPYDLKSPQIVITRLTHSQEPYTPIPILSSPSAATRRCLTTQLSNPEVRTGRENNRFETGFPKAGTEQLMLNHALKDEAATACVSSFSRDSCQPSR